MDDKTKKVIDYFDNKLLNKRLKSEEGIKFKNLAVDTQKVQYPYFVCECHDSMEEHFMDIVEKDGYAVGKTCYSLLVKSIVDTEREIMMKNFEEWVLNQGGKDV